MLQVENRTLAVSLQQLSTGAELSTVIDSLPERLRTMAALPPGTAPPLESSVASPTWRRIPDGAASGTPSSSPSYPWMTASTGNIFSSPTTPKSTNMFRLSPMSGSSSPFHSPGASNGRWGTGSTAGGGVNHRGRSHSPPVPFDTSTSLLPNMTKPPAARHQGIRNPSPTSRMSPGGALGGSNSRFSNNINGANNVSPTWAASAWNSKGVGGVGGPATLSQSIIDNTPLELDPLEFPELAALEEQFQQAMLTGGRSGKGDSMASAAAGATASATMLGTSQSPRFLEGSVGGHAASRANQGGTSVSAVALPNDADDTPDVRALKWARKNKWFGDDMEMTEFAYKVLSFDFDQILVSQ